MLNIVGGILMARPIGDTPVLEGDEAAEFLNKMFEPPTEKEKELKKKMESQRRVYFWDKPME